jgi:hypothetical protein
MKNWQLALLIKPLVLFLMFAFAYYLGKVILYFVPEGRIKRLLTRPVGGIKRLRQ